MLDKENAEAATEIAKLGQELVKAGGKLGNYLAGVLADTPHELVGVIGDKIKEYRLRRQLETALRLNQRVSQIHEQRNISTDPDIAPLKVLEPLIESAVSESRNELVEVWARLIANATDPDRINRVRKEFIVVLDDLAPEDALIFESIPLLPSIDTPEHKKDPSDVRDWRDGEGITEISGLSPDIVSVSLTNLERLGCIVTGEKQNRIDESLPMLPGGAREMGGPTVKSTRESKWSHKPRDVCHTPFGRELIRAIEE